MIGKIDTGKIQDLLGKLSSKQPDSTKALTNNGADASLHVDYAALISRATQIPNTDTKAIQQAKELLESGQLESSDKILEAVKNMIKYSI